ncbi:outer membrane protein assembly factor BamC [Stutzerimonas azotifigens]|uniref:outer membrane protein assembly factor BamC n=1 Tax=Stutzerimonas azotifigens TaxID=291995 RepID=UPI0003FB9B1D|nr:outer membrane protein assembly factor BamC [Stutzerimonas azotifigens]
MKRLAGFSTLALIVSSTSGCGWLWGDDGYFRDRGSDYLAAHETAPMEIPAGVQMRPLEPLLPVPQQVASPRNGDKYEVPRPQKLQVVEQASDFSLQRSGERRWLVALRSPAQAWTAVRQYFADNGFAIAEERPQTGEFVTEWQRPGDLDGSLARHLGNGSTETRVRVRVEPGVQRNTSEISILSAQRPAGSSADVPFAERPEHPNVDAALLDGLLTSLASGQQGGPVSLLAERQYDAPDRVAMTQDGSGNPILELDTDLNRAWSSVGRALQAGDVRVDDLNRSLGVYYINLAEGAVNPDERPGFFARLFGSEPDEKEIEARAQRYQVRLTDVGNSVQVSVEKNLDTVAPADVAQRILRLIQDNLG